MTKSEKPENDIAGINRRSHDAVVYLVRMKLVKLSLLYYQSLVLVFGILMYGFVGLEADLNTVKSVVYSEHKETPGLGAEVMNPAWKALWPGKKIYNDASYEVKAMLVKGGAKADDIHGVDGLIRCNS